MDKERIEREKRFGNNIMSKQSALQNFILKELHDNEVHNITEFRNTIYQQGDKVIINTDQQFYLFGKLYKFPITHGIIHSYMADTKPEAYWVSFDITMGGNFENKGQIIKKRGLFLEDELETIKSENFRPNILYPEDLIAF